MIRTINLIFLLLVSTKLTSCFSQEVKPAFNNLYSDNIPNQISDLLIKYASKFPNNTQLSIAIVNEKSTKYIGLIRQNDSLKYTNNKKSIFEIGSITKVFTGILLADFISKNQATASETIQENFEFPIKEGGEITLQQLSNHTSGLPRLPSNMNINSLTRENPYKYYTPELLENYLQNEIKLKNKIGKRKDYSNLGTGLLGYILTKKAKKSYEDILQERIFNPLKMNNSTSNFLKINNLNLVKGQNKDGTEVKNWEFTDALIGAGGILSNVLDMEKFIRKNLEKNTVYNLSHKTTFTQSSSRKIGLGWMIYDEILWHNGATGGYLSYIMLNKQQHRGVVILTNIKNSSKSLKNINDLCLTLLKIN